jgi:hypothetical protein
MTVEGGRISTHKFWNGAYKHFMHLFPSVIPACAGMTDKLLNRVVKPRINGCDRPCFTFSSMLAQAPDESARWRSRSGRK